MFKNNSFFTYKKPDKTKQTLVTLKREQDNINSRIQTLQNTDKTIELKSIIASMNQKLHTLQETIQTNTEKTQIELSQNHTALQTQIDTLSEKLNLNERKIETLITQNKDLNIKVSALLKSLVITKENVANLYNQIRLLLRIKR